jgi:flagellin
VAEPLTYLKEEIGVIVNTNIPALLAMNALDGTQQSTQTVLQQLSTGYRINSAADDPAGLAIATEMNAQVGGLNQAYQNAQSANSLLQVAEGGIGQDQQILQQIRSLAVEASNGTMTASDRQNIQQEVNQLIAQINDNASGTTFNNKTLLTGTYASSSSVVSSASNIQLVVGSDTSGVTSAQLVTVTVSQVTVSVNGVSVAADVATAQVGSTSQSVTIVPGPNQSTLVFQFVDMAAGGANLSFNVTASNITSTATSASYDILPPSEELQFQIGADANTVTAGTSVVNTSNTLSVTLGNMNAQALGLQDANGNNLDVSSSQQAAENAIQTVDNALSMLTTARANVGAYENQLTYTMSNLQTESTNLQAAQSDIMDVNMAQAMTQFTQDQVLLQSGAAMLGQAQALPDLILKLLG